jgi:hypothetical protein
LTVAIAAMCLWFDNMPVIVGASDRMITSGDIEFEPERAKIYGLTNSIAMLISGDTAAQTDIRYRAHRAISARLDMDKSWMRVEEVAEIVSRASVSVHRDLAERTILEPLGLTFATFMAHQNELQPSVVADLLQRIQKVQPGISTIIAGVDEAGAHAYKVFSSGYWLCSDAAGFAAIGAGARHAESQFMFARHAGTKQFPETQLLTYTAKRRAEVAPGVGPDTDLFVVFGLGGYQTLPPHEVDRVKQLYERLKKAQDAATTKADNAAKKYIEQLFEKVKQQVRDANSQERPEVPTEGAPELDAHASPEIVEPAPDDPK